MTPPTATRRRSRRPNDLQPAWLARELAKSMGKIKVDDLARMMNIPAQDLLFKLQAIGVRVEDADPRIDSEIIQAILEGKKLPSPREVILRDGETQAAAPQRRAAGRPPPAATAAAQPPAPGDPQDRAAHQDHPGDREAGPGDAADRQPAHRRPASRCRPRSKKAAPPGAVARLPAAPDRGHAPRPPRPQVTPEDLRGLRGSVEEVEEAAARPRGRGLAPRSPPRRAPAAGQGLGSQGAVLQAGRRRPRRSP